MTQYPVVTEVSEDLGWKIQTSNDAGDWDVYWTDFSIDPDILIKMHLFQKINHFPGIHVIARKNLLGQNLTNMSKKFPNEYNFFSHDLAAASTIRLVSRVLWKQTKRQD